MTSSGKLGGEIVKPNWRARVLDIKASIQEFMMSPDTKPNLCEDVAEDVVVDLDGTLVRTDLFQEGLVYLAFRRIGVLVRAVVMILSGQLASAKSLVARSSRIDVSLLPYNADVLAYLNQAKKDGRRLHLATAANEANAQQIADHLGLFETVFASDETTNLKGSNKLAALKTAFPEGFTYVGDSPADKAVWTGAKSAVVVGNKNLADGICPVERTISDGRESGFERWVAAARVHQWSKNGLMFVPLLTSHFYTDFSYVSQAGFGFILFCFVASGTYMLNDLYDLEVDRQHKTKSGRPFASGQIAPLRGFLAGTGLIFICLLLGTAVLRPEFTFSLLCYVGLTTCYSLSLKSRPFVDITTIAALFTLRAVCGAVAIAAPMSLWLFTFIFAFFFALSSIKRFVEIRSQPADAKKIPGRGYQADDEGLIAAFGIATGMASLIILTIYLALEAFPQEAYQRPQLLWFIPLVLFLWLQRLWLMAYREQLHDDPIVFVVKDRLSLTLSGIAALGFLAAIITV